MPNRKLELQRGRDMGGQNMYARPEPSKTFKHFAVFCAWDAFCPVAGHVQQSVAYVARDDDDVFYMISLLAGIYPARQPAALGLAYCQAFMKFRAEFRGGQLESLRPRTRTRHPKKMSRQLIPTDRDEVNKLPAKKSDLHVCACALLLLFLVLIYM